MSNKESLSDKIAMTLIASIIIPASGVGVSFLFKWGFTLADNEICDSLATISFWYGIGMTTMIWLMMMWGIWIDDELDPLEPPKQR